MIVGFTPASNACDNDVRFKGFLISFQTDVFNNGSINELLLLSMSSTDSIR